MLHTCQFSGTIVEYAALADSFDIPQQFRPGDRVGHVIREIADSVDLVRYRSLHGMPHSTYVILSHELIYDQGRRRVSAAGDELHKALSDLEIELVD